LASASSDHARRNTPVLVACGASVAAAAALGWGDSEAYSKVLGIAHPVPLTIFVAVLGYLGLGLIVRRGWAATSARGQGRASNAALLGAVLTLPVVLVDCLGGFGLELNAAFPDSLLFYPSIALLAEFAFHVTPLALAALVAPLCKRMPRWPLVIALAFAVCVEPALQVWWAIGRSPPWVNAYVGLHLLVFNLAAVHFLRRYGIMRAYLYRVSYYAVWHIAWGHVRPDLLF
jgi:hypothetical protein